MAVAASLAWRLMKGSTWLWTEFHAAWTVDKKSSRFAQALSRLLSNSFSDLPVALVGNFVFQRKRTFGERKRILRPPRTIPVAILLVEIIIQQLVRSGSVLSVTTEYCLKPNE
jgi:hypothetical protein